MELSLEELCKLITVLNQTDITELTIESEDLRLSIHRGASQAITTVLPAGSTAAPPVAAPPDPSMAARNLVDVTSPMVGTFYSAASPDAPPFVCVGDVIQRGQTVCIVEAMKLMNDIESDVTGRVAEILVENAQPVEYGQVLMRLDPG